MKDTADIDDKYSRWPHFIAVTLVCVTFPLIWVGGLVTTYDAGMAVPDWPTTYGYNMFLYPLSTWISAPWDLFIEHGHRLLGSLAGLVTIALNVAIWRFDSRRWMRWVGAIALALVISQGLLGGMRVQMNSTDFARIHGCTGPLFFATCVAICVMTSRFWFRSGDEQSLEDKRNLAQDAPRSWLIGGWLLVGLAYLQLVIGAHLRHPGVTWTPMQFRGFVIFHVVLALVLLVQVVGVANIGRKLNRWYRNPSFLLLALVFGQLLLGLATWRAKYGWPAFVPIGAESTADQPLEIAIRNTLMGGTVQSESMVQAMTVTGHVAVGSLILATAVCYATRLSRGFVLSKEQTLESSTTCNNNQTKSDELSAVNVDVPILVGVGGSA